MAQERPDYLSYLLRMWRAREGGEDVWRASLHSPQTGEQMSFCTLEELSVFLLETRSFNLQVISSLQLALQRLPKSRNLA